MHIVPVQYLHDKLPMQGDQIGLTDLVLEDLALPNLFQDAEGYAVVHVD